MRANGTYRKLTMFGATPPAKHAKHAKHAKRTCSCRSFVAAQRQLVRTADCLWFGRATKSW